MNKTILSICIPTYNRAKLLANNLLKLIKINNNHIEFVISDNASTDNTQDIVKKIKDERIKYFRNKENLGFDANILQVIKFASGEFIFLLSDEDQIKAESIPWILNMIKENKNISQIWGKILTKKNHKLKILFDPGQGIYKLGYSTIFQLGFKHPYVSGIILKKKAIFLADMKKYIGCSYIHQFLSIQAMMQGQTICTTKITCYNDESSKKHIYDNIFIFTKISKYYSLPFYTPKSRIIQLGYRNKFLNNILPKKTKIRYHILKKERKYAAKIILESCFVIPSNQKYSFFFIIKNFLKVLPFFKFIPEISKCIDFWIELINTGINIILNVILLRSKTN